MVKARKYVVKIHFVGEPKRSDYSIEEYELPELKNGEILVKVEFISMDPYLRAYNIRQPVPYDQWGLNIGLVQESKDRDFPKGTRVISHNGWCDYYIGNPSTPVSSPKFRINKIPDLEGLPYSLGVGAVGMPGATSYFGLLDVCWPKTGETVVVTGAAGAVGSTVGQIAKIKGCRVIGIAGSDDKVEWLEKELNFDKAINYKKKDVTTALKAAAPNGIDCYFDNVGGEISSKIISQMNLYGRVAVCGSISAYNEDYNALPQATILQPGIVFNQLKIEGFNVYRFADENSEALEQLAEWVKNGQIKAKEHVTEGF